MKTKYQGTICKVIEERPDVILIEFPNGEQCWVEKRDVKWGGY
jgi:hypothetical protein